MANAARDDSLFPRAVAQVSPDLAVRILPHYNRAVDTALANGPALTKVARADLMRVCIHAASEAGSALVGAVWEDVSDEIMKLIARRERDPKAGLVLGLLERAVAPLGMVVERVNELLRRSSMNLSDLLKAESVVDGGDIDVDEWLDEDAVATAFADWALAFIVGLELVQRDCTVEELAPWARASYQYANRFEAILKDNPGWPGAISADLGVRVETTDDGSVSVGLYVDGQRVARARADAAVLHDMEALTGTPRETVIEELERALREYAAAELERVKVLELREDTSRPGHYVARAAIRDGRELSVVLMEYDFQEGETSPADVPWYARNKLRRVVHEHILGKSDG